MQEYRPRLSGKDGNVPTGMTGDICCDAINWQLASVRSKETVSSGRSYPELQLFFIS